MSYRCLLLFLVVGLGLAQGQPSVKVIDNLGVSLPGTCEVGQRFHKTDAPASQKLYLCVTANTWELQGGGGGGANHNLLSTTHSDTVEAGPVLGDLLYGNAAPAWTKLPGNTTTTKRFLAQTGTGSISAAPEWSALTDADIPNTITLDNITQITARSHTSLTDIGVNSHATIDTHLSAAAPHSGHEVTSNKNVANGYAGLNASTKLPLAQGQEVWSVQDLTTYASVSGTGTTAIAATITSPSVNDVLTWNGTNWVNQPGGGGSEGEVTVRTSSDTANSTTSLTNAAGLSFSAEANSEYWIRADIYWETSATTVGIQLSASFSQTGHTMGGQWVVNAANGTVDGAAFNANDVTVTTTAAPFTGPNTAYLQCFLKTGANAGTWTVRFAAETTGTVTIKAGSIIRYQKTL